MSRSSSFLRSPWHSSQTNGGTSHHQRGHSFGERSSLPPAENLHRSRSSAATVHRSTSSMQMTSRGLRRFEQRRTMEQNHFLSTKARSQNLNPPIDMRLLDYVIECDENLMCPICRCPFVDPVVLAECDHCFCRDCIRQTWTTSSTAYNPLGPRGDCPTCRTPAKLGPRSATSKILVNILDDLLVKCPKSSEGCLTQVKRGEVQDHVSIYCGFAMVECPADDCELPVLRKELSQGCLHYGVSCIACHEEMQKSNLEVHWRSTCPDRQVTCDLCKSQIFYRELEEHNEQSCPAISIPCPGKALGCSTRSKRGLAEIHAQNCTFAKLAPIINAQKQRLDEQESAQKQMSRKLEILDDGFSAMHNILYPKPDSPAATLPTSTDTLDSIDNNDLSAPIEDNLDPDSNVLPSPAAPERTPPAPPAAVFTNEPFPPPSTTGGPYASPLHHLLSLHESLRDELARTQAALQQLDARHSMQTLNENLRTREEVSYITAQVAGLQRQVHWLTSAQLQSQRGAVGSGVGESAATAAGSVGEAVRMVGAAAAAAAGGMRRVGSEEGRTKL